MANKCKYHFLVPTLETVEFIKEVCTKCGHREVYKKVDGKIDNTKYARDHIADFCQPHGATRKIYLEIYGESRIKENRVTNEQQRETLKTRQEMKEAQVQLREQKAWQEAKDNLEKLVL